MRKASREGSNKGGNGWTKSEKSQRKTEKLLEPYFIQEPRMGLKRESHAAYVLKNLGDLQAGMQGLDCSQPWMMYWTLHAADILGILESTVFPKFPPHELTKVILHCLAADEEPSSALVEPQAAGTLRVGFGGGPGQCPHLAATYAAGNALAIIGCTEALDAVDRPALTRWLISLRNFDGSFRMHRSGEVDIRATYCVACICTVFNLDMAHVMPPQCAMYVARCQNFEGGIGVTAEAGAEAHGGYTHCGLAALLLMRCPDVLDIDALRRWCVKKQIHEDVDCQAAGFPSSGGFCGRTNKLVDSCYSYWLGGCLALLRLVDAMQRVRALPVIAGTSQVAIDTADGLRDMCILSAAGIIALADTSIDESFSVNAVDMSIGEFLYNQQSLQMFLLQCCQSENPMQGGFRDKPQCYPDTYHTCYSLSGLSLSQNQHYVASMSETAIEQVLKVPGVLPTHHNSSSSSCNKTFGLEGVAPGHGKTESLYRATVVLPPASNNPNDQQQQAMVRPVNALLNICCDRASWLKHRCL